jgi:hypothetical protein
MTFLGLRCSRPSGHLHAHSSSAPNAESRRASKQKCDSGGVIERLAVVERGSNSSSLPASVTSRHRPSSLCLRGRQRLPDLLWKNEGTDEMRPNSPPEEARNVSTSRACATSLDRGLGSRTSRAASEQRRHERIGPGIRSHHTRRNMERAQTTSAPTLTGNSKRIRRRRRIGRRMREESEFETKPERSQPVPNNCCPVNKKFHCLEQKR